jgi:serine protease AprX
LAVAERTQPAVIADLERLDVAYRPYWIANMIWVRGDLEAVERLAVRSDVAHLYANPRVPMALPPVERAPLATAGVEPNVSRINAPAVWAAGIDGGGVVVGGQDTGYAWDHPALSTQYRGWDGASAAHDYNWYDADPPRSGRECPAIPVDLTRWSRAMTTATEPYDGYDHRR